MCRVDTANEKAKEREKTSSRDRRGWMTGGAELNCPVKLKYEWKKNFSLSLSFKVKFFLTLFQCNIDQDWQISLSFQYDQMERKMMKSYEQWSLLQLLVQTSSNDDTDECGKVFSLSKFEASAYNQSRASGKHQNHWTTLTPNRVHKRLRETQRKRNTPQ